MANCLTCIHQEVCKERMEIFNLPNIACQYEAHELVGEWIETSYIWETEDLSGWGYWKECSSCHCQEKRRRSFCPNCGADMRGEAE